jgi:hypothetical protein
MPPVHPRPRWHVVTGAVLRCSGVVALFALLVAGFVAASAHAAAGNSDGATVILEGHAFVGGNLLLNHWALSLDSFWLVDVPIYALAVAIGGLRPEYLHLVPAIVGALVVLLGAWTAAAPGHRLIAGDRRRAIAATAGVGFVVVMLGLPTHAFALFFLMGPLHVVTTLWCMTAFVALRRGRFGWGWMAAVVLLAAGMLGDLQAIILGVGPVVVAGAVLALRTRSVRVGLPALSAGVAAVLVAKLVRLAADAIGTFSISVNPRPGVRQMGENLQHLPRFGAALFGLGSSPFGGTAVPVPLQVMHGVGLFVGLGALAWGVASAVRGVAGGRDRDLARTGEDAPADRSERLEARWLTDVTLAGVVAGCVTFVVLPLSSSGSYGRYLTAAVIFLVILGGRFVSAALGWLFAQDRGRFRLGVAAALTVASLVVAADATSFASALSKRPPHPAAIRLSRFLARHHLDHGIGDYWSSAIVTVESHGQVVVRPVIAVQGHISRYLRQSDSAWYDRRFQFLVFNSKAPWGEVNDITAIFSFGYPAHIDRVGPYRIWLWSHPVSVPDH